MNKSRLGSMLIILICTLSICSASQLFAGNGLRTYSHTILHDKIIEVNCTTYDDCYDLLCSFLFQPVYLVTLNPNNWNGNCNTLNRNDNRQILAEIDTYIGNTNVGVYNTKTVSDSSLILCSVNKNSNITEISYFVYSCP
jgi:hypothetical protein